MKEMHSLLKRQLKRNAIDLGVISPEWEDLLESVNEAYWEADNDRIRLDRSLEISYQEMLEQYRSVVAQLIQTEKMSSLGQVVAGVAHEVNNPINFISGNLPHVQQYSQALVELVCLYKSYYPEAAPEITDRIENIDLEFLLEDINSLLESMKLGAQRIKEIVLSLRNFSRLDESELKQVDIHEGLESTLLLLQHSFCNGQDKPLIQVIKNYGSLPLVECYAGELNQVFMNIISNAIDSLLKRGECFSLATKEAKSYEIKLHSSLLENNRIKISIQDNGLGIAVEIVNRLFDPFFTTKPVGKGMGLSLATSYQIVVNKHGGDLRYSPVSGGGAEFIIEIPLKQLVKEVVVLNR